VQGVRHSHCITASARTRPFKNRPASLPRSTQLMSDLLETTKKRHQDDSTRDRIGCSYGLAWFASSPFNPR
jgi:hypothetical protein